jgi:hypothetical protein
LPAKFGRQAGRDKTLDENSLRAGTDLPRGGGL